MLKRSLIVFLLVPTLMLAVQPSRSVHGVVMTTDELAMFSALDAPDTTSVDQSKDGNGFIRALKAPFKAFGRLFGGKKKNDDGKLQRITQKDLRKFETVPARVVTDTKTTTETRSGTSSATTVTNSSDYTVHFNSGRAMLNAGDVNGAITELSRAVSLDSKSAEARNLLGVAYEAQGMRSCARDVQSRGQGG